MIKLENYDEVLSGKIAKAEEIIPAAKLFLKETRDMQRPFGLFQPNENVIAIVKPSSKRNIEIALGFPFPVAQRSIASEMVDKELCGEIIVCFRGAELRQYQRTLIVDQVNFKLEYADRDRMGWKTNELGRNRSRAFYINPYSFLGDSIIGLYFLDRIKEELNIQNQIILSPSAEHQSFLGEIHPAGDQKSWDLVRDDDLVILPDLIDNHLPNTIRWIGHLHHYQAIVLVIGRGLLIDYSERVIYALNEDDPLLRNTNIQDYMNDCLSQFFPKDFSGLSRPSPICYPFITSTEAFINPFSSLAVRDLTPEFIVTIVDGLIEYGVTKVHISNGVKDSEKDSALISTLTPLLEGKAVDIEYHWFKNLSGIACLVKERNINLLFSPDTSVPHMFNAMGRPVFTVYKSCFWDPRSIQSLSSDSPLGFCRFQLSQIPILTGHENESLTPSMWKDIFICFQRKISPQEAALWLEEIDSNLKNPEKLREDNLEVLSKCAEQLNVPALMSAFDIKYFFNILGNFPPKEVERLYKSLVHISPIYKWLKLQLC